MESPDKGVIFIPFGLSFHVVGQGPEGLLVPPSSGLLQLLFEVLHGQLGQIIAACGGVQQIGGQLGVKDEALALNALVQQLLAQFFHPVGHFLHPRAKELSQEGLVIPLVTTAAHVVQPALVSLMEAHRHPVQIG